MMKLENESKNNSLMLVNVCLDYSGQWDIAQSCMQLLQKQRFDTLLGEGNETPLTVERVSSFFAENLSTGDSPVDVVIRTGNEHRISNFLLWQISYAEIYVMSQYWPDLTFDDLRNALEEVANRSRRFGK